MTEIQKELFALRDLEYQKFHSRLMPTIDPNLVIGVRTPQLRKLAKNLKKDPDIKFFLQNLPHKYYEENNLHGFMIADYRDYEACLEALDKFLPFIDNWATCDLISPKVLKKQPQKTLEKIREWTSSGQTYTIRFGLGMLMSFYLDEMFHPEYLTLAASIKSEEYYVNMMIAWFFATALAKQYEATIPFIEQRRLDPWTHRKAIQKAVESRRITEQQKLYLKSLK